MTRETEKAREDIRDAVRYLAPRDIVTVLREMADEAERLEREHDRKIDGL